MIKDHAELLNRALAALDEPEVSDNPLFKVDSELSNDLFTRLVSTRADSIPLAIDFSESGIDVHLDGASEVLSWGRDYVDGHPDEVIETLATILASNAEVSSCGKNFKRIRFKDPSTGETLKQTRVLDGLLMINPFDRTTRLYPPIVVANLRSRPFT